MRRQRVPLKAEDMAKFAARVELVKSLRRALRSPSCCLYGIDQMQAVALGLGQRPRGKVQLWFPFIRGDNFSTWTAREAAVMARLLARVSEVAAATSQSIDEAVRAVGYRPAWSKERFGRSTLRLVKCRAQRVVPGVVDALFDDDPPKRKRCRRR